VPGYLLDLNHVSALFNKHPLVLKKVNSLGRKQVRACAITLGEAEAGHQMDPAVNATRTAYTRWLNTTFLPNLLEIRGTTREFYAKLIGGLWQVCPKTSVKMKTERHLVLNCGVDINDVWMAACALEHGLVMVTQDKMEKIKLAVAHVGESLDFECWL